jgi:hypothetical protein
MHELHAFVAAQGNVHSRKSYDPSGYQISTPGAFPKTFRTLDAAVLYGVKKGYKVSLVKPLKESGQSAYLSVRFDQSLENAARALALAAAAQQEE